MSFVRFARNLIVDSYVEMMTHDLFLETSDVLESDENQKLQNENIFNLLLFLILLTWTRV